jgi:hypothetical protein
MRPLHLVRAAAVVAGVWLGTCPGAAIGEFTINLKVQAGQREQSVASGKPDSTHAVFPVKVMEVVSVQWSAVNGAPGITLSDITLHVFMDRASTSADGPRPGPKALYESAVIVDFEPERRASESFECPCPKRANMW